MFGHNKLIVEDGRFTVNSPGLYPSTDVLGTPYTFCMIGSPYPSEWKRYPELFQFLVEENGSPYLDLYAFDVYLSDRAVVGDAGRIAKYLGPKGKGFFSHEAREDFMDYVEGLVPLEHYGGGFDLPELLVPRHIAYKRLTKVNPQKVQNWLESV